MSEAVKAEGAMETLRDRLAELADDAPTAGAPAAELWARGKRAHRLRAAALAATLLVVGAVGTGVGLRLSPDEAIAPARCPRRQWASRCRSNTPFGGSCRISGPRPAHWWRSGWLLERMATLLGP